MATKTYKVRFYEGNVANNQTVVSDLLNEISALNATGLGPTFLLGDNKYQIRELVPLGGGASFKGAFAKLRDDAPHIADENGPETPINLGANEHLIEKNYFLYFRAQQLLVYQTNFSASSSAKLGQYLTAFSTGRSTVSFNDLLKPDALAQLLAGNIKSVEVAFSKPKKLANYANETNWSSNMMQLLRGSGAGTISVKVSTRSTTQTLAHEMRGVIQEFMHLENTRKLKVKLEEFESPIDLMAECIKDEITVTMNGIYPNPVSIYAELDRAKTRQDANLQAHFG